MKILILDDARTRRNELEEKLRKKKNDVTALYGTSEFIEAIGKMKCDLLLLDLESWNRGKPIYMRFGIARRLEDIPIVFYNALPAFSSLDERSKHPKDKILPKPTLAEAVIAVL